MKLTFVFLLFFTQIAVAGSIRIKPFIPVTSDANISIAAISELEGLDKKLLKKLNHTIFSAGPQTGDRRVFSNREVSIALRKALTKREISHIRMIIPHQVVIENRGLAINTESVKEHLVKSWKKQCSDCKFIFKVLNLPLVPQSYAKFPWKVETRAQIPKGTFSLPIHFKTQGIESKIFWVNGQLEVQRKVPVTSRSINIGERLTKKDISWRYKDITFSYDSTPSLEELIGKKVRLSLRADQVIWHNSIVREQALTRGDIVRAIIQQDKFNIVMMSQAESNGQIGDTVRLKNLKTKKIFLGVVTAKGEVVIK